MKFNKKGVDWTSPTTLVIVIIGALLGFFLIFYFIKLKGRLLP